MKDRKKILDKIKKITDFAFDLDRLNYVLERETISEEVKDEVEKGAWKLIRELSEFTS